jgi:hypothetical protein
LNRDAKSAKESNQVQRTAAAGQQAAAGISDRVRIDPVPVPVPVPDAMVPRPRPTRRIFDDATDDRYNDRHGFVT